jgi:hypothetical protein
MLPAYLMGFALVVGLYLLGRGFLAADPRALAQGVRYGGMSMGAVTVAYLAVTGRLGIALALGAFLVPAFTAWRSVWEHLMGTRPPTSGGPAAGPAGGQVSQVETVFLRMMLHHESGAMAGEVLHGVFQGRMLDSLSPAEVARLLDECRAGDPPSAALLETWLDRSRGPEWRRHGTEEPGGGRTERPGAGDTRGGMTRDEACDILGVASDATPEQIKDAHRRLMLKVHPDHGGSTWLAAQINQAKDRLL